MNVSYLPLIRLRLAQLAAHLVVALVVLVVIGGATRVMEAGLACPDWPLCYGSLVPKAQMNIQVFLEWFHRLDAFVIGISFLLQFCLGLIFYAQLPKWLVWTYGFLTFLVGLQGILGALTVTQLLPSGVVTAHLGLALTLVASLSGITQRLLLLQASSPPSWWPFLSGASLLGMMAQCLIGGRMATGWAVQKCLINGQACYFLDWHRSFAIPASALVLCFVFSSFFAGGWPRRQWPFLLPVLGLLIIQISLGILTVRFDLTQPALTVCHQLVATLLVAVLAALCFRSPQALPTHSPDLGQESSLEPCHG